MTTPRITVGDRVRVRRMVGWPPGTTDVTGATGAVVTVSPDSSKSEWQIGVQLDTLDEVWGFSEAELDITSRSGTCLAALLVRVVLPRTRPVVPRDVRSALLAIIGDAKIEFDAQQDIGVDDVQSVSVRVWPARNATEAFELLLEAGKG